MWMVRTSVLLTFVLTAVGCAQARDIGPPPPAPTLEPEPVHAPAVMSAPTPTAPSPSDAGEDAATPSTSAPDASRDATQTSQVILRIDLTADGRASVDARPIPNDDAVLELARDAIAKHGEVRGVIDADSAVTHGRVVHVIDLLKQAGVTRIAFGVMPAAPAGSSH
jgi:biopolymer transport protein ExbD